MIKYDVSHLLDLRTGDILSSKRSNKLSKQFVNDI